LLRDTVTGRYTYKDELIGDGVLKAVEALLKFDPEKSKNPFGYFTQVIYHEFCKRLNVEYKQRKIRESLIMVSPIYDMNGFDADTSITKDQIIGNFEFDSGG
jgi:hypothetical protein